MPTTKIHRMLIAAILALGAFSLFAFPVIGHALGLSDQAFGLWAGLAVDNTAEATAAGALYADAAAKFCRSRQDSPSCSATRFIGRTRAIAREWSTRLCSCGRSSRNSRSVFF
jgi:hypothetical protein